MQIRKYQENATSAVYLKLIKFSTTDGMCLKGLNVEKESKDAAAKV